MNAGLVDARYTSSEAHSGSWSGLMGIVPPEPAYEAHSSIYQEITIPWDATSATLSFWYKPFAEAPHSYSPDDFDWTGFLPGQETFKLSEALAARTPLGVEKASWATQDWQFALIRYGDGTYIQRILATNSNAGIWLYKSYDLMPWRGQRIWVHFEVRNDAEWRRSWMYVDDVEVRICR